MGRSWPRRLRPRLPQRGQAAKGAKIEKFTSQYDEGGWAAKNLLEEDSEKQWAGKSGASQEVVVALPEVTGITDVSINNYSREDPSTWAKDVEVEVSSTFAYKEFKPIGKMSMPQVGDLHTISLAAPVPAKYVKVLFRANHGGGYMEAARVRVFATEAVPGKAIAQQLAETGRAVVREIRFTSNSAEILSGSEAVLTEIARLLQSTPTLELIIEGHTDNVGGAERNLDLSRRRAAAIKRWLVDKGKVAEVRLTTAGYGLTRPVADNGTEEGRAQNRRVELIRR
jgi:outer membrane protein OmpA-like peptidoglycan-associated protein